VNGPATAGAGNWATAGESQALRKWKAAIGRPVECNFLADMVLVCERVWRDAFLFPVFTADTVNGMAPVCPNETQPTEFCDARPEILEELSGFLRVFKVLKR
jgi:hypothetical protein